VVIWAMYRDVLHDICLECLHQALEVFFSAASEPLHGASSMKAPLSIYEQAA